MRWTRIDAKQADAPAARYGHVAVVVDTRDVWGTELVILHGGVTKLPSDQEAFLDDVSVFNVEQEAWVRPQISPEHSPGPRAFHSGTAIDKGLLFFGGQALIPNTTSRTTFNDVWFLCVGSWMWNRCAVQSALQPSARSLASIVHIENGRVMLFGGRNESSKALDDLWILHVGQYERFIHGIRFHMRLMYRDCWERVIPIGATPPARIKHAMAFVDGDVWLYGGETTTGSFFDDLWTLREVEGTGQWQWHSIRAKPRPIGRSGHAFTPIHDNLIACFGGHTASAVYMIFSQSHICSKELWVLDPQKHRWNKLETPDDKECPVERVGLAMIGMSCGKIFVFGGRCRDKVMGDNWWLELDAVEARTPSSHSLSSLASSALQMHPLVPQLQESGGGKEPKPTKESTKPASSTPFLGSVWGSMPSLTARGLLSRMSMRTATSQPPVARQQTVSTPRPISETASYSEMSALDNGNEDAIEAAERINEGPEALYSYFDIDRECVHAHAFPDMPDDQYIDLALISYAQSRSVGESTGHRSQETAVAAARRLLMQAELKEFKLGNLWLLLADYKRLLLKHDILKAWTEEQASVRPKLNTRFLHFTMDTLRLSDLPELLLDYTHLLQSA